MSTATFTSSMPVDPKELRSLVHVELDKLSDDYLAVAHRLILEMQLQQVTGELDDAADKARAAGRLTPERITHAIKEHRAALEKFAVGAVVEHATPEQELDDARYKHLRAKHLK